MNKYRVASYYAHDFLGSEYFTNKRDAIKACNQGFKEAKENGISKSYMVVVEYMPKGDEDIANYEEIKTINGCECSNCQ